MPVRDDFDYTADEDDEEELLAAWVIATEKVGNIMKMITHVQICPARNVRAAVIISELLRSQADFIVTLCKRCRPHGASPDVLVVTTGLAGKDELEHVADARSRHPRVPIIVLSLCDDVFYGEQVLSHGADHFMLLDEAVPNLSNLIASLRPAAAKPAGRLRSALAHWIAS